MCNNKNCVCADIPADELAEIRKIAQERLKEQKRQLALTAISRIITGLRVNGLIFKAEEWLSEDTVRAINNDYFAYRNDYDD